MNKKLFYLILVLLIVSSCMAFSRITGNDFINCDDDQYITDNYHIQAGIHPESIKWAFTTTHFSYWHPLAWLSHIMDWSLFGANASYHHLVSLLLHIGAIIFLFLFLNKTTKNVWAAAFAAAFFALHPLRVESVAWAAERKDVLSMFFGMACLYVYSFYAENLKKSGYFLCLALFTLALMSKQTMVTLPFILMLLDYWPLNRWQKTIKRNDAKFNSAKRLIWEKIPFILLTIVASIIIFWAQNKGGRLTSIQELPIVTRIFNAIVSYATYLVKMFWPFNLAVFYPYKMSLPLWEVALALIILACMTIAALQYLRKLPFLFVGWFWYMGAMIPLIGLVQAGAQAMADRHTYLPSIGIAIIISWGSTSLIKNKTIQKIFLSPAGVAVLIFLSVLTWHQCSFWKNSSSLFYHALRVTENNYLAHGNLARALLDEGKNGEAIHHFQEVIRIKPNSAIPYNMLGDAYTKIGQYESAVKNYNHAISLDPAYANAYNNRGTAYSGLNETKQALEDLSKAIQLKRDYTEAYYNRGVVYILAEQYQNALQDLSETIRLNPVYIPAYFNRGMTYARTGHYQLAIKDYEKIIRLKPDYADAYNNRAAVYLTLGNNELGCRDARKACELGVCKILEIAESHGHCRHSM